MLVHKGVVVGRTFVALIGAVLLSVSFAAHSEEVRVIDISDGKITLIGRLGLPLGTVARVEGQLVSAPKLTNGQIVAAFRVSKVDGKKLTGSQIVGLAFRASRGVPALGAGQLLKLSGYEDASTVGTPEAAREAMGSDASPVDRKFASVVHVIEVL